jgi:YlmC/YmxH family sporulation protein
MGRAVDFRQKEVINIIDGKRLGFVNDIDVDLNTGELKAIIVPGTSRFLGLFTGGQDVVIPWNKIKKIGEDTILVEL